jgi:3-deoxy-manno-octulosonate cytidylyltransferase (CMP-KDO synthetase)
LSRSVIIIPARLASTRFPAKPLAPLRGPDGVARPALTYTWKAGQAAAAKLGNGTECVVATDDAAIASFAEDAGMRVVMTPTECRNGTERCAAALDVMDDEFDLVINLQGDAPLTPANFIVAISDRLASEPQLSMTTAAVPATAAVFQHLQSDAAAGRVGGTTVACNRAGQALYFSKSIIPYVAPDSKPLESILLHLGVYAYRTDALRTYAAMEPAIPELQEGLEQLRFLDAGLAVGVCVLEPPAWEMIELNNPSDVPLIEKELAVRNKSEEK